jgi:hypothetical protein
MLDVAIVNKNRNCIKASEIPLIKLIMKYPSGDKKCERLSRIINQAMQWNAVKDGDTAGWRVTIGADAVV